MRFSAASLNLIEARASTLSERFQGRFVPKEGGAELASRRLERVKYLVAKDEPQTVATALAALGAGEISDAVLLIALGIVERNSTESPSPWTHDLNQIVEALARSFALSNRRQVPVLGARKHGSSVPYEHLYLPIAEFAWAQVASEYPVASQRLGIRARFGLQNSLVRRLSSILSSVLHPAFLAHQSLAASAMMRHFFAAQIISKPDENRAKQYAGFVAEQGEDGMTVLFTGFPAAARLVAEVTRSWIDFVGEFLERLRLDEKEIAQLFNNGTSLGNLIGVRANLSDPHHGGRSVLILTFHGGLRLVYKPRPMGIDHQFYELIWKMNAQNSGLDLGVLKICDQGTHGWMEFARHEDCTNERAANRYFYRVGALACLVFWLQGIDFHRENVVASGEQPLLLDLECLAHPLRESELATLDAVRLAVSVLRTGLLPLWQVGINGARRYDNCGFDAAIIQRSLFPAVRWREINTDRMHWTNEKLSLRHSEHRAFLRGKVLSISSFELQVCAGYRGMAHILEGSNADTYVQMRNQMYRQPSRRIKRPTFLYATVLRRSLHPAHLGNGVDRSIELLMLPCKRGDEDDWAAEITSLEQLDIPYFQYQARSKLAPSVASLTASQGILAQQAKMVSASVRRRVKLDAGKLRIEPIKQKRNQIP